MTTDLVEPRVGGSRGTGPGEPTRHTRVSNFWWVAIVAVVVAIVVVAIVVLQSGTSPEQRQADLRQARAQLASEVTTSPSPGATLIPLNTPVTVTTHEGHFTSVIVTTSAGQPLLGSLNTKNTSWTSNQPLAASATYLISATVENRSKLSATAKSSFTTLTPSQTVTATVWPDGVTVGVGQPIVLRFSKPVTDQAARQALLSRFKLAMSSPVPVGAYWFSSTELHLRPENFWPTGEQISFSDSLSGWQAGSDIWGSGAVSVNFTIGDARISTANLATHEMSVTDNGKVIATYPISGGRAQYPTMNGVHVVLDRESKVQMISSTVGIPVNSPNGYNETVYWDVHISDSGEYVHAAPWSVGAQGNTNVSHGCINISPSNAEQFFSLSHVGDIVNVVGGPRAPVLGDHGVMDWTTPWSDFTPVSVTALPGSSPASSQTSSTPSSSTPSSTTPSSTTTTAPSSSSSSATSTSY